MRAIAITGLTLVGCGYQPGSFHSMTQPFPGERVTIDCLDLAIERRADLPAGKAVVAYGFGNRCDHPIVVDLASAAVVGRAADGTDHDLRAYDPRHEIEVLRIDGRAVGGEAIAYPSETPVREVCVDAASIAHAATAQWLCFPSQPQLTEVP